MSVTIILVRPREEGNVGAVARAMANMGLERLVLVEPAPEIDGIARGFGVGGWEVLDRVERAPSLVDALAPFRRVVGTASLRERPLSGMRVVAPRELPVALADDPPGTETALVFGPEDNGLSRRELLRCSLVTSIPCAAGHPTLNLAQAVLIVAYELHLAVMPEDARPAAGPGDVLAAAAETEALLAQAGRLLCQIGYDQKPIHAGLLDDLRRLLGRADASAREGRVLRRLLNRAERALEGSE